MGFGFNLFFSCIIFPVSLALFAMWLHKRKSKYLKSLLWLWGFIISGVVLSLLFRPAEIIKLKKEDYYGHYVIDQSFFDKKQAEWQYNHFRFKITDSDSIFFYITEGKTITKTYSGRIETTNTYSSERLVIKMDQPTHHVLASMPTTIRSSKSFYLVFKSSKYHNMFFRKGKWESTTN
ncbi:hypothetical protein [Flammeovirga sp. SJP92]|uniref:hypothetical protein n=1 Tax=Flammeovirga sp. SJP92 TaxID=1775430 RepID=UPI0007871F26|nr:hypothetical protein [Flammeovirga sp. SJP92]KXX67459.1 hypothetical protein AVL50_29575 [Flammeovirga sp. SJP92]